MNKPGARHACRRVDACTPKTHVHVRTAQSRQNIKPMHCWLSQPSSLCFTHASFVYDSHLTMRMKHYTKRTIKRNAKKHVFCTHKSHILCAFQVFHHIRSECGMWLNIITSAVSLFSDPERIVEDGFPKLFQIMNGCATAVEYSIKCVENTPSCVFLYF